MKSFTEIQPKRVGLIGVSIMAVIILCVFFFNRSLFASGYQVSAQFPNAAGIGKGTEVLVAGVKVGTVSSLDIQGDHVIAHMSINSGTVLPHRTTAAIQVQTLLGVLDVALQPETGWSDPLRANALITDTSVPTEFYQLQNTAGKLLQATDTKALNNIVSSLATITKGKQTQVAEIIQGLGKLTTTVNERSGEVGQLIDSANQVSSTLASRDQQLTSVIDNLNTITTGLTSHSTDLANLIVNIDQMSAQTNSLVSQDQPQLNTLLQALHSDLGVVGQHQVDLAETVSYLGAALKGFSSVGYSGPANTPNTWANVFVNPATLTQSFGVLGPCGVLDQALNQILGPDPLGCDDQTGPLPGSSPAVVTSGGSAVGGSNKTKSANNAASPNSGVPGLSELLSPLLAGKK